MWKIKWIDIELTSFCNIHCEGCFREISKYADNILNKQMLSLETIQEKFKREDFPGCEIINFCGSVDEPTSHPQFFDIIKHFAEWNVHINIATNGSLRTVKWWTELAGILPRNHSVTWGIDGVDETSEIYRRGSKFKIVEKNYRAFIKAGGRAKWQFIVFDHNKHQEQEVKIKALDEGFKNVTYIYSHREEVKNPKIKHTQLPPAPKRKDKPKPSKPMPPNPEKQGYRIVSDQLVLQNQETKNIECKYKTQNRIFVNHMGNVIPCCHLNSEMLEYTAGREENSQFTDILNSNAGELAVNLKYNSIHEVMEGDVWKEIADTWPTDKPVEKCWTTCKKRKHDVFIKESL